MIRMYDRAVRIKHIPTGIVVQTNSNYNRFTNTVLRFWALRILCARLYAMRAGLLPAPGNEFFYTDENPNLYKILDGEIDLRSKTYSHV